MLDCSEVSLSVQVIKVITIVLLFKLFHEAKGATTFYVY